MKKCSCVSFIQMLLQHLFLCMLLLLLSLFSHVRLCATPQTAAHQAPLSTGFSRQEYWSGLPFPSPLMYENVIFYFKKYAQEYFNCNYEMCGICKLVSRVRLVATPWAAAYQDPLSMGFSRQEYWSGLPFPSPGDLPNPGMEPGLPHCRQTFYCLSHRRSLKLLACASKSKSSLGKAMEKSQLPQLSPHAEAYLWNLSTFYTTLELITG